MNEMLLFWAHTLIGFYFTFFGVWNVYHWSSLVEIMIKKSIPHPIFLLAIGIAWQATAGILIMMGVFVKLAAISLIAFTLISICIFYSFWSSKGEVRKTNFNFFITHLTMTIGGLLLLLQ